MIINLSRRESVRWCVESSNGYNNLIALLYGYVVIFFFQAEDGIRDER